MSCLFNSLAPAVNIHPTKLRELIVDYLKTNPNLLDNVSAKDIILWTEGVDFDKYLDRMNNTSTWGGAIEIRAYCELFRINVVVHVLYTRKEFEIKSSQPTLLTTHISYTGNHFEPMYTVTQIQN